MAEMWPQGVPHLYGLKAYIEGIVGESRVPTYCLHTIQSLRTGPQLPTTVASFLGQDASLLLQRDTNDSSGKLEGTMSLREEILYYDLVLTEVLSLCDLGESF